MSDLDIFYQNCLELRQRVLLDPSLQARIKNIMDVHAWKKTGNNATYSPLEGTRIGLKRRTREHYHPDVELAVTACLWTPRIPVSRHIVVVRQCDSSISYLVEDFGELLRYGSVRTDLLDQEAARIIEHANARGIDRLSELSMGHQRQTGNIVVYDLDGGASFTGKFDALRGGWFDTFQRHDTKYGFLRDIRDKLLSPEFTLTL